MNILVVENNLDVIEDIQLSINEHLPGLHISVVGSGEHCLETLNNGHRPDLVILGFRISDMDGFELLKDIRDDSDLPVVFLSEDKDINTLVKAFESGANDYIVEPFNKAIFAAKLKAIIRRKNWDIKAS
ncbi:MAG: response regulator [Dehalococcoidales bacterium]|nr:response regulator [Dehalococcoidales bacterium]